MGKKQKKGKNEQIRNKVHWNLILSAVLIILLVFCYVVGERLQVEAPDSSESAQAAENTVSAEAQVQETVPAASYSAAQPSEAASPSPSEEPKKYTKLSEDLAAVKSALSDEDELHASSLYQISDVVSVSLQNEIDAIHSSGHSAGFIMFDLNSGEYLSYNADQTFYSASSIKAFYVAAAADEVPDAAEADGESMKNAVMYSDNDAYMYLHKKYHYDIMHTWCDQAQVPDYVWNIMYPDYNAREVCQLWTENYYWFMNDAEGQKDAWWYESPNMSNIRKIVDEDTVTRTKAGWIAENYYDEEQGTERFLSATNEGGIIYAGDHPFIIAVMSDVPSDFEQIYGIEETLIQAHQEMVEEIYGN